MKSVPVQPKNLEVTAEVHPSIKSYAELSCSVYVIGYSYEALVDKELWSEGMATLSLEMARTDLDTVKRTLDYVAEVFQ